MVDDRSGHGRDPRRRSSTISPTGKSGFQQVSSLNRTPLFAKSASECLRGNPFTVSRGCFTTPNEAYFEHAELGASTGWRALASSYCWRPPIWATRVAARAGIANGSRRDRHLRSYGRFLGKRYRSFKNIIWVQAGDFNPPDKTIVNAIAEGIAESAPGALHTAHCAPGTAALDYWCEPWLSLNSVYTKSGRTAWRQQIERARKGQMPFIFIESTYENQHGVTQQQLRMQAYDALLSGAAGQVFGNNPPGTSTAPVRSGASRLGACAREPGG